MLIKFVRKEELSGEIWYRIFVDDNCIGSFREGCDYAKRDAQALYSLVLERAKQGYPKEEIIASSKV